MKSQEWSDYDVFERIELIGSIVYEVARFIGKIGRVVGTGQFSDHPLEPDNDSERESHSFDERSDNLENGFSPNGTEADGTTIPLDSDPDRSGRDSWI
jgi:hypothetical protein